MHFAIWCSTPTLCPAHSATCVDGTPAFSHVDTAACRRSYGALGQLPAPNPAEQPPATPARATAGSRPPSEPPRWARSARRTPTPTPCSAESPPAAGQTRPNRRRALPARRGLARSGRQNPIPGPRCRLLPQSPQPRRPAPSSHRPTRTARLPCNPRTAGELTNASHVHFRVNSGHSLTPRRGRAPRNSALVSGRMPLAIGIALVHRPCHAHPRADTIRLSAIGTGGTWCHRYARSGGWHVGWRLINYWAVGFRSVSDWLRRRVP